MNLSFQFANLVEFWQMAGHGPYVWGCYGLTAAVLIYLAVTPVLRKKKFLAELQRQQKIAEREKQRA